MNTEKPGGGAPEIKQTGKEVPPDGPEVFAEPVWKYRGYSLRASEFTTAMVHLFRAEVSRTNVWRQRLDTTTNWAVVTTGAVLSFAFSQPDIPHIVLPLNLFLVTFFLVIEARRYRYYELWSYRVRLMETDFFAAMLVPPFQPSPDWAESLAEHLLHPHFSISNWEALGRRLRRNYMWIYMVIQISWAAKLWLLPFPIVTLEGFIRRAAVGPFSGDWVLGINLVLMALLVIFSIATLSLQEASGEVLPRYGGLSESLKAASWAKGKGPSSVRAWFRPQAHRQQMMAMIITDREEAVSQRVLKEMTRGVTRIPGTGMFTGKSHSILLSAMTLTEIPHLKALVNSEDPNAFVIVTPAQEIFGRGFMPLSDKDKNESDH